MKEKIEIGFGPSVVRWFGRGRIKFGGRPSGQGLGNFGNVRKTMLMVLVGRVRCS